VSHILVTHRHEAEDLLRLLGQGRDFAELARRHSRCASADAGGDLGEVDPRRLDEDFREALEALAEGQVSGIVRTRFGFHLIRRDSQERS
jgi:peptidyl-prolyl cis-trans isomerase C